MSKIIVVLEVDDELADPRHETGLTNEGYELLMSRVTSVGDVVDVRRDDG